ncbi:MAG: hypothetical protein PHY30_00655 [Candidatus Pacebacteria bacterium]|nr:hypothetical protein [Candidatus Paceibacterota bacterium]
MAETYTVTVSFYRDCTHTNEPGCRVLKALQEGDLNNDKYLNIHLEKRQNIIKCLILKKERKIAILENLLKK